MNLLKPITIRVLQRHIDHGVPRKSGQCAVSLALGELFPWARRPDATAKVISFTNEDEGLRYRFPTPDHVWDKLLDFDAGKPITPFSFVLKDGFTDKAGSRRADAGRVRQRSHKSVRPPRSHRLRIDGENHRVPA